ncbi:MAG TPA: POTRA domain-containing protein [Kofleriaceae bacterium]
MIALAAEAVAAPAESVEFVGARSFGADELRAAAFGSNVPSEQNALQTAAFQTDLLRLAAFYWDRGFAEFKIGMPSIQPGRIAIPLDEGVKYAMGTVGFSGDLLGDDGELVALIQTRAGQTFSRTMIATDRELIARHYQDRGYAFAAITPLTKLDRSAARIAITFEVAPGKAARVEGVAIHNTSALSAPQIAGAVAIASGTPYSAHALADAKRRIEALGVRAQLHTQHGSANDLAWIDVDVAAP